MQSIFICTAYTLEITEGEMSQEYSPNHLGLELVNQPLEFGSSVGREKINAY